MKLCLCIEKSQVIRKKIASVDWREQPNKTRKRSFLQSNWTFEGNADSIPRYDKTGLEGSFTNLKCYFDILELSNLLITRAFEEFKFISISKCD